MRLGYLLSMLLLGTGLYFLGGGLTGMVVSETCCDPGSEGCTPDNACSLLQQLPGPERMPYGFLLVALGVGVLAFELRRELG